MLLRDEAHGPSVYLTRRSARSRFMPDAYVFPGGAVDTADRDPAMLALVTGDAGATAPGVAGAALRELLEEAGILFARDDCGERAVFDADQLAAMRAELAENVPFARILTERGLTLDAAPLIYYSNWITPATEPIRFDAHFFLARAPENQLAAADSVEVHDGVWLAPGDALARADRGEMTIILPTRKHLERLAALPTVDALIAHARARRIVIVQPRESQPGEFTMNLANDAW